MVQGHGQVLLVPDTFAWPEPISQARLLQRMSFLGRLNRVSWRRLCRTPFPHAYRHAKGPFSSKLTTLSARFVVNANSDKIPEKEADVLGHADNWSEAAHRNPVDAKTFEREHEPFQKKMRREMKELGIDTETAIIGFLKKWYRQPYGYAKETMRRERPPQQFGWKKRLHHQEEVRNQEREDMVLMDGGFAKLVRGCYLQQFKEFDGLRGEWLTQYLKDGMKDVPGKKKEIRNFNEDYRHFVRGSMAKDPKLFKFSALRQTFFFHEMSLKLLMKRQLEFLERMMRVYIETGEMVEDQEWDEGCEHTKLMRLMDAYHNSNLDQALFAESWRDVNILYAISENLRLRQESIGEELARQDRIAEHRCDNAAYNPDLDALGQMPQKLFDYRDLEERIKTDGEIEQEIVEEKRAQAEREMSDCLEPIPRLGDTEEQRFKLFLQDKKRMEAAIDYARDSGVPLGSTPIVRMDEIHAEKTKMEKIGEAKDLAEGEEFRELMLDLWMMIYPKEELTTMELNKICSGLDEEEVHKRKMSMKLANTLEMEMALGQTCRHPQILKYQEEVIRSARAGDPTILSKKMDWDSVMEEVKETSFEKCQGVFEAQRKNIKNRTAYLDKLETVPEEVREEIRCALPKLDQAMREIPKLGSVEEVVDRVKKMDADLPVDLKKVHEELFRFIRNQNFMGPPPTMSFELYEAGKEEAENLNFFKQSIRQETGYVNQEKLDRLMGYYDEDKETAWKRFQTDEMKEVCEQFLMDEIVQMLDVVEPPTKPETTTDRLIDSMTGHTASKYVHIVKKLKACVDPIPEDIDELVKTLNKEVEKFEGLNEPEQEYVKKRALMEANFVDYKLNYGDSVIPEMDAGRMVEEGASYAFSLLDKLADNIKQEERDYIDMSDEEAKKYSLDKIGKLEEEMGGLRGEISQAFLELIKESNEFSKKTVMVPKILGQNIPDTQVQRRLQQGFMAKVKEVGDPDNMLVDGFAEVEEFFARYLEDPDFPRMKPAAQLIHLTAACLAHQRTGDVANVEGSTQGHIKDLIVEMQNGNVEKLGIASATAWGGFLVNKIKENDEMVPEYFRGTSAEAVMESKKRAEKVADMLYSKRIHDFKYFVPGEELREFVEEYLEEQQKREPYTKLFLKKMEDYAKLRKRTDEEFRSGLLSRPNIVWAHNEMEKKSLGELERDMKWHPEPIEMEREHIRLTESVAEKEKSMFGLEGRWEVLGLRNEDISMLYEKHNGNCEVAAEEMISIAKQKFEEFDGSEEHKKQLEEVMQNDLEGNVHAWMKNLDEFVEKTKPIPMRVDPNQDKVDAIMAEYYVDLMEECPDLQASVEAKKAKHDESYGARREYYVKKRLSDHLLPDMTEEFLIGLEDDMAETGSPAFTMENGKKERVEDLARDALKEWDARLQDRDTAREELLKTLPEVCEKYFPDAEDVLPSMQKHVDLLLNDMHREVNEQLDYYNDTAIPDGTDVFALFDPEEIHRMQNAEATERMLNKLKELRTHAL